MFRRSCVDREDVFTDSRAYAGVEDWELWLMISREYRALYAVNQMVVIRAVEGSVSSLGNTEKMFRAEKAVLRSQRGPKLGRRPSLRLMAKAFSYRHAAAAWGNLMCGDSWRALRRIVCVFSIYPPMLCRREYLGLCGRIVGTCCLGRRHDGQKARS